MVNNNVKAIGVLFLLSGVLNLVSFFFKWNAFGALLIRFEFASFDLSIFIFAVVLLNVGYSIINFNPSGRVWGLLILWWHFLAYGFALVVSVFNMIYYPNEQTDLKFQSVMSKLTYVSVDTWILSLALFVIVLLLGIQIFFLSQKGTKTLFVKHLEI